MTWPGPTYGVDWMAGRFARDQLVVGDPPVPSPPSALARSCPGSGPHVPSAAFPYQPSEPVFSNAIVTVVALPGQSVGKPERAESAACAPSMPYVAATGATPGATESVQVT